MRNGHAYVMEGEGGGVYFDVGSLPGYGSLSGRAQEDNKCVRNKPLIGLLGGLGGRVTR
jgi:cysteinyl-tRNA synthetase